MHVAELWRYPVKSMQGEQVEAVDIGPAGADGDRVWAVFDVAAGKVLSAKRERRLLESSARTGPNGVEVSLPDGLHATAGEPGLDEALTQWLGREVRLVPGGDAGFSYQMQTTPLEPEAPIVDIPMMPGRFLDLLPVHVLTTASLMAIGGEDRRRFRPTVLVDGADGQYPEDEWVGGTVTIGSCAVTPLMPTVRCAMTGHAQPGLDEDRSVTKRVFADHVGNLGIYASVAAPGRVAVGDAVTA